LKFFTELFLLLLFI
jgi:hypothetical protein